MRSQLRIVADVRLVLGGLLVVHLRHSHLVYVVRQLVRVLLDLHGYHLLIVVDGVDLRGYSHLLVVAVNVEVGIEERLGP